MTSILVLLALLSLATLASRRGAFEELLQSASTPLLVGVGVLVSPTVLGLLPPSTLTGLQPAVDFGAMALAFFIGTRAARSTGISVSARTVVTSVAAVALSCVAALAVLRGAAFAAGETWRGLAPWAGPLLAGACLAGLPAESERTPAAVRAWARVSELCALAVALAALCLAAPNPAALLLITLAVATSGAALLALTPTHDDITRTIALLGVLAFVAGLMRLVEMPTAAAGFVAGVLVGRVVATVDTAAVARRAERPVRVVLTIVVAASIGIDWTAAALGVALAVGQLAVQITAARIMGVHRTQLGSVLASSSTPIAWVAALVGAQASSTLHPLLAAIVVAVAVSDVLAVFFGLAQRRAWSDEQTNPGSAS